MHFHFDVISDQHRSISHHSAVEFLDQTTAILNLNANCVQSYTLYLELFDSLRQMGRYISCGYVLVRLGHLAVRIGDLESAANYLEQSLAIFMPHARKTGMIQCLLCYADLHRVRSKSALAVQLLAVTEIGQSTNPFDQMLRERVLAVARLQLSATEFSRAWHAGQQMTVDAALALARTSARVLPLPPSPTTPPVG